MQKILTPEEWSAVGGDHYDHPTEEEEHMIDVVADAGELRIKVMDEVGIDFAQMSLTTPGAEVFAPDAGKEIASTYNDTMIEAIANYPDRLGAYMALYPDDVEWSLKEIDKCVKGGLYGWSVLSNFNGNYIDHPSIFQFWRKSRLTGCHFICTPIFLPRRSMRNSVIA